MFPASEPNSPSKGNSSANHPTTADPKSMEENNGDPRAEEKTKENKEKHSKNPPKTKNSSTMTCTENHFQSWPPQMYPPLYPYNGGFFSPQLPTQPLYYPNQCNYNSIQVPNVPFFPSYCNGVSTTQSATSFSSPQSTQSNMSNVSASSYIGLAVHGENVPQNHFQPVPFSVPVPSPYNPYPMCYSPFPIILSPGQMIQPSQPNSRHASGSNAGSHLCSNCSREIISLHEESQNGERPVVIIPNVNSFVDSEGRLWRCMNLRSTKPQTSKMKETTEASRGGISKPGTCQSAKSSTSAVKKNSDRVEISHPDRSSNLEDSIRVPRMRKFKARGRKNPEDNNVSIKPMDSSIFKSPQLNPSCSKIKGDNSAACCHKSRRGLNSKGRPTASVNIKKILPTNEDNESHQEESSMQVTTFESEDELDEKKNPNTSADKEKLTSSFSQDANKTHSIQNEHENVTKFIQNFSSKHENSEDKKPDGVYETASCNDLRKRGAARKAMSASQYPHNSKTNEDELWSSSSSGTYDDSEAFDCYKLLRDIKQQRQNIETTFRQSRQRSRDRLFRKRAKKVGSARSEEGFDGSRQNASPSAAQEGIDRSQEQVIMDTSQVRITEETPKRFIVESKKDSGTPKSMTITVQADVARPASDICEFCSSERRAGTTCVCHVPPCQRPQWQAPPCPANEIHGTPVHCCHDVPPRPPRHGMTSRSEMDEGETSMADRIDEYRRSRRQNLPSFGLISPWNQRNVDRPHEESRHPHFGPPRPSVERFENIRRDQALPTNRRRWHNQDIPGADTRVSPPAEEMLRIQIPSTFPRYRMYDYPRNHEDGGENNEGCEGNDVNRNRNTIDINIFRTGIRRLGTNSRRNARSNSPRSRAEEASVPDEDPENSPDFCRRPRSAITVRKTNFFSVRNRKLEEEVQRIESGNDGWNTSSTTSAKEGQKEYSPKETCNGNEERQFEDGEKPDSEYEEVEVKLDPKRHRDNEDEEDD